MFPYRVKYTESEYDIQNNDLLYKTHQTYQNTFDSLEKLKIGKQSNCYVVICIISINHILYFLVFW